jgi:hypothetical protein
MMVVRNSALDVDLLIAFRALGVPIPLIHRVDLDTEKPI